MGFIINPYLFAVGGVAGSQEVHNFSYTGSFEEVTAPAGTTDATIILWGGGGGGAAYSNPGHGGPGGALIATFPCSAGDTIKVEVGQGGQGGVTGTSGGAGGWPDGGGGGNGDVKCAGGGGSSRFYINGTLKAVAGAGGGGAWRNAGYGGYGGGTTGGTSYSDAGGTVSTFGGSGGTQAAGGVDLSDTTNTTKKGVLISGTSRTGGWGSNTGDTTTSTSDDGGGGGGGYYGGGGGGGDGQPGGGGSSWTDSDASGVTHYQGKMGGPSFGPDGAADIGHGGIGKSSGTGNPGGNGYAKVIFHDGGASVGVLGLTGGFLSAPVDLAAGYRRAIAITVPGGGVWVQEIQIALPPTATATITAGDKFRGVIYSSPGGAGVANSTDALVVSTSDYTIVSTDEMKLIRCAFATPQNLSAGDYWLGLHASGGTDTCSVGSTVFRQNTGDTFSDGADSTWGTTGTSTGSAPRIAIPYTSFDPS